MRIKIHLPVAFCAILLSLIAIAATGQESGLTDAAPENTSKASIPEEQVDALAPCKVERSRLISFTDAEAPDTLTILVGGGPCSEAGVRLTVTQADGNEVYRYQGRLIDHLPALIYEPQLGQLMSYYVKKALRSAFSRTTKDLPEYSEVSRYFESTGDFVVIKPDHFDALRQENLPILWHKTGESTWVYVVFDAVTGMGEVIMRGGTQ
ncbi:hypothetical protein [Pseudomaricurvus sp.]|uniref:hypothetical protein n=1 Tax=Pseudomaricurvus sp. TaxID=2004510 RepID=UPI003F6BB91C